MGKLKLGRFSTAVPSFRETAQPQGETTQRLQGEIFLDCEAARTLCREFPGGNFLESSPVSG